MIKKTTMPKLSDLFDVRYGVNLELNALKRVADGVNFVSRTAKNNGVSARVAPIPGVKPIPAGTISVAGGGSVMESFLQTEPYYSGRDLYYLTAKISLTDEEKLYYCACLRANRFRFNYGRQANRTLKSLLLPSRDEIPNWVKAGNASMYSGADAALYDAKVALNMESWSLFKYEDLFQILRGRGPRIKDLDGSGETPFVTSIDGNNGLTAYTSHVPTHPGNVIAVNRNGSVAEAFYQPVPFCSTEDVHIFLPKFELNVCRAMFLSTIIRLERYRFGYGRKWGIERMKKSVMKLPIQADGTPDWELMERYIKSLPFSSQI
jgi:hypothetical protein